MIETEFGHSISFIAQDGTTKNTWDDWGLIADSRPTLSTPPPKTNILDDVKMINGNIDLTNSMVPYTLYGNREGTFTFIYNPIFQSLNGKEFNWIVLYGQIMQFVHGKKLQMVLEDDDEYYYEGRFHVENWTSNNDGSGSTITIGYSVYPYKRSIEQKSISLSVDETYYLNGLIGVEPLIPIIYWWTNDLTDPDDRSLSINYVNEELGIDYDEFDPQCKYFDPLGVKTSKNVLLLGTEQISGHEWYLFKDLDMIFYDSGSNTDNYISNIGGNGATMIKFHEGKL